MTSRIVPSFCCAVLWSFIPLASSEISSPRQEGEEIIAGSFSSGLTPGGTPAGWRLKKITGRTRFSILTEGKGYILRVDTQAAASGLLKQVALYQ
jgi:hypothetical protein